MFALSQMTPIVALCRPVDKPLATTYPQRDIRLARSRHVLPEPDHNTHLAFDKTLHMLAAAVQSTGMVCAACDVSTWRRLDASTAKSPDPHYKNLQIAPIAQPISPVISLKIAFNKRWRSNTMKFLLWNRLAHPPRLDPFAPLNGLARLGQPVSGPLNAKSAS
jgi:hypothetical protein